MRRIIFLLFLLTPIVAMPQQDERAPSKDQLAQAPTMKIEELLAHPDRYDKTLVRVNALWVDQYHGSLVCPLNDNPKCLGAECPDEDTCKDLRKVLYKSCCHLRSIWRLSSGEQAGRNRMVSTICSADSAQARAGRSVGTSSWYPTVVPIRVGIRDAAESEILNCAESRRVLRFRGD